MQNVRTRVVRLLSYDQASETAGALACLMHAGKCGTSDPAGAVVCAGGRRLAS